jgi:hypothetical protein
MAKRHYGFEFFDGENTTAGEPNLRTHRLSIAGELKVFKSKPTRDAWVKDGKITSGMQGCCRRAVSYKEARALHLGISPESFEDLVDYLSDDFPSYSGAGGGGARRFLKGGRVISLCDASRIKKISLKTLDL